MTDDDDVAGGAPAEGGASLRPQLGLGRVVSQDVGASACAILGVVMLITAGIMWPKAEAVSAAACVGVAVLMALVVAWRVASIRGSLARAVRMRARLTRNRVEPIKHGRSLRRLTFAYEVAGRTYQAKGLTATHGPHAGKVPGDPLWILVDPKHPSRAWLLEQFVA